MSYVIQTEDGLVITDTNPIDKLDSVEFAGNNADCIKYISIVS